MPGLQRACTHSICRVLQRYRAGTCAQFVVSVLIDSTEHELTWSKLETRIREIKGRTNSQINDMKTEINNVNLASTDPSLLRARNCARKVLKPLLRVLHAAGLSEQELAEISRQTIRRLPDSGRRRLEALRPSAPLEHVIARWTTDPAYLEAGEPRRLRLRGSKPSFTSLVRSVSSNTSATAVLKLLDRRGLVRIRPRGQVQLLARFYPVRAQDAIDLELFTTMTIDFLRTHEFNFLENPPRGHGLFQRIAHKRYADARIAPEFNRYVREHGQLFLEAVDDWLNRHKARVSPGLRRKVRLGVGIYVINETLR